MGSIIRDRAPCQGCPLGPTTTVAGTRGPVDARICIVGEAPGYNELREGTPFIGEAGKLLGKVLTRAGIDESACFITNALRCRPPVGKAPGNNFITACQSRLLDEVAAYPRDLVLAFGNTAVRSLTGNLNSKITIERGRARQVEIRREDLLVVPTFHPAAILRSPGDMPKLLDDVKYAAGLLSGLVPKKEPKEVEYEVATLATVKGLIEFLIAHGGPFGCDIETADLNPRRDPIHCLAVDYEPEKGIVFPDDVIFERPGLFHRLFKSPGPFVWHNGKFDASFLRKLSLPVRVDQDTMLMHYLMSEGQRELHGLKELSGDYLGADPEYDKPVSVYRPFAKKTSKDPRAKIFTPRPILYRYCAMDTNHTLQLYHIFNDKLHSPRYSGLVWAYENIMIPASRLLQDVERYGVWVHKPTVEDLSRELVPQLRAAEEAVTAVALDGLWDPTDYAKWKGPSAKVPKVFNPGSSYQLLYVFGKMGLTPRDPRTKKVSTNVEALKRLPPSPFVSALLRRSKVAKMLSTYVDGIWKAIDTDGRVHSTYKLHGTATGRLSSANPNMQNIPRDSHIRNIFQAPPDGRILVELDYSQVELRVLAYLSGDEALQRVYREGRDLHDEVATSLFGPNFTSEQRVRAKFVNFGIAYGRGADSLVAEFRMPKPEAQAMINNWWATFPQARTYTQRIRAASRSGVPLETPFGRRRAFSLVTNSNKIASENEAVNFGIQSTASDLTLLSAIYLNPRLIPMNAHVVNLVHDSILIECDVDKADAVVALAREVMEDTPAYYLQTDIPFRVSNAVAIAWGQMK